MGVEDDPILTDELLQRLDEAFEAATMAGRDPAKGLAAVVRELEAAVQARPEEARLREEFGFWLGQIEDWLWGMAFERCQEDLVLGSADWYEVYVQATHRLEAGETEAAVTTYRRALTLAAGPPYRVEAATRWGLAAALKDRGDRRARAELARVLALLGDGPGQGLLRRLRAGRRLLVRLEGTGLADR